MYLMLICSVLGGWNLTDLRKRFLTDFAFWAKH